MVALRYCPYTCSLNCRFSRKKTGKELKQTQLDRFLDLQLIFIEVVYASVVPLPAFYSKPPGLMFSMLPCAFRQATNPEMSAHHFPVTFFHKPDLVIRSTRFYI